MPNVKEIAEQIRQGLFFEEFEKQRNDQESRKAVSAASALDQSKHERQLDRDIETDARNEKLDADREFEIKERARYRAEQQKNQAARDAATADFRTGTLARSTARDVTAAEERGRSADFRDSTLQFQTQVQKDRAADLTARNTTNQQRAILSELTKQLTAFRGDDEKQAQIQEAINDYIIQISGGKPELEEALKEGVDEGPSFWQKFLSAGADLAGGV